MIEIMPVENSNLVNIPVTESFHKQDYEQFAPKIDELVKEHGTIRILFDLARFHGWNRGALWFGIRQFPNVERVAVVGDMQWEIGIGILGGAFKKAQVRYFDYQRKDQAVAWVKKDDPRT